MDLRAVLASGRVFLIGRRFKNVNQRNATIFCCCVVFLRSVVKSKFENKGVEYPAARPPHPDRVLGARELPAAPQHGRGRGHHRLRGCLSTSPALPPFISSLELRQFLRGFRSIIIYTTPPALRNVSHMQGKQKKTRACAFGLRN